MAPRQVSPGERMIQIATRVPSSTAAQLQAICDREYRSLSAELRRLIEQRIEADELEQAA